MPRMPTGIASDDRAPREWFPALTVAVALALPCPAGADVLVKQKTVSEGLGGSAPMSGVIHSTRSVRRYLRTYCVASVVPEAL